jgi:hypothetical protein
VVDDVTASGRGRWRCVKGLNRGREQRRGGSRDDSTTAQSLPGGLDDGTSTAGEVNDGAGSRENFSGKFWQPDGVSESLRGLEFAKAAQQFIYRRITVATGIGDVIRVVATENHSSSGRLPSSAHC